MKKLLAIALLAGTTVLGTTSANAAEGCGRGYHRGPAGRCRLDYRPRGGVVVAPGLVIGGFYGGRGYWDGHRYWHDRYRDHGGWRYR